MLAKDFVVGTTVTLRYSGAKGTIVGNTLKNDTTLAVEWVNGCVTSVATKDLVRSPALEAEFNALKTQVNGKIQEATKSMAAALKLAATEGLDLSSLDKGHEYMFPCHELTEILDAGGWNSSRC